MTGEEWITRVFEPALGEERIRFHSAVDDLGGGLRALEACGLLDAARAAECQRRLRAANEEAHRLPPLDIRPPGGVADRPTNELRHVLAPGVTPLAEIEGVTVALASVEVWTRSVRVLAAALAGFPSDPGEWLRAIEAALTDDVATVYKLTAWSGGGVCPGIQWAFLPGVPDEARQLTFTLSDPDGRVVGELQIAVPDPR